MNLWDIAALVPVIRGAGGVTTDAKGGPAHPAKSTLAARERRTPRAGPLGPSMQGV